MFGFVRYVRSEVSTDDTVPGWLVLFVHFFFDVCGDVLLNREFVHCGGGDVDSFELHFLAHIRNLHDCFPLFCGHGVRIDERYESAMS